MNPTIWIAHILAFHLNVPEPVEFRVGSTYPFKYEAMVRYTGRPYHPEKWTITYDEELWNKRDDKRRMYVIAHELCHAAYEYDVNWDTLPNKERKRRHVTTNRCAAKIIRDHRNEHRDDAKNRK